MALVRHIPYRTHFGLEQQMRDMQQLMNALMSSSGDQQPSESGEAERGDQPSNRSMSPVVDVYRDGEDLMMEFELPGIDIENDVNVEISDGVLTVQGQRSSERSEDRDGMYLRERQSGSFFRRLSIPDGVEADDIEADYSDGVLRVRIPVPEQDDRQRGPRRIEITNGKNASKPKGIDSGTESDQDDSEKHGRTETGKSTPKSKAKATSGTSKSSGKRSSSKSDNS